MIRLTCTNCKTVLTMDDAFAGGVCRCQHCGTIQTVPTRTQPAIPSSGAVAQAAQTTKTLYQNKSRLPASPGSGLDELAEVVVSSGLSSHRLRSSAAAATSTSSETSASFFSSKNKPILLAGGAIIVLLIVVVGILLSRSGDSTGISADNPAVPALKATFLDVPLKGSTVIYVLDRGDSTREIFHALLNTTFNSIASLGADHRFQIIFWNNGSDDLLYPTDDPVPATTSNLTACRDALESTYATGQTDIRSAIEKAVAKKPDTIVIATAKGWDLDNGFVTTVLQAVAGKHIKIDTFSIGSSPKSEPLRIVAEKSGGEYREISNTRLQGAP